MMFRTIKPIAYILLSIGMFFFYIQPTFLEIREIQNETNNYSEAITKASEFNQKVNELVTVRDSFSAPELKRLEAFIPDDVDETRVMNDLQNLAINNGMVLLGLAATEWITPEESEDGGGAGVAGLILPEEEGLLEPADPATNPILNGFATDVRTITPQFNIKNFNVSVLGTYGQFKEFVTAVEQSLVLLEVESISFGEEGEENSALGTYSVTFQAHRLMPLE